ncbi:hypothetical protein [Flavobacterium sp. HJJ]|uniref:hypothetical protein n=1 Tax=Flavobacterium sp. HJJ TaxID=2783792 RepID=UPI00188DC2A9|nr:hypothetical protein [Flavobacterium sp. HJJ]MBF4472827.1 hypothetical protein [Flavobacterium sp. HJJ]
MKRGLTAEQIEYISNYIQSFGIKWYELQVELTDHFISIMEEIWQEDEELTFHQVKYKAEQRFDRNYFEVLQEERSSVLRRKYKKQQWQMVAEYLKFPKIMMSFLLAVLMYRISFYLEDISLYIKILYGTLLGASAILLFKWYLSRKIKGQLFLSVEMTIVMNNSSIIITYFAMMLANNFKEALQENHLYLFPFCFLWVVGVLLIITGKHLTDKVVSVTKKQYQLI